MIRHQKTNSQKSLNSLKPSNKDWMYSIQMNRWFLKPIGAWPLSLCIGTREKINCAVIASISCFFIGFLLIPCALCTMLDKGDLDTKIKMIGPLSFCCMAAAKYYILMSRGITIGKCITNIRDDWYRVNIASPNEDRVIMIENAKFGRLLTTICAGFMYSGGFFYSSLLPLCVSKTEIINNETVRSTPFPIYRTLFDPRSTPFFEIVQFLQCLSAIVLCNITVSTCSLAAIFVTHACGQFKILMINLDDLVDGVRRKDRIDTLEERLGDIVEHHLQILCFISDIEDLLSGICLVELVGCTLNICFLGYYLITEWEQSATLNILTYLVLLLSFMFNIFILCYIGQILSEECRKVGFMAYMVNWYYLPGTKARDLMLVVAMSNLSPKLTAGKFVQLSLSSFCSVLKSAMGYLNLLRTLTT